MIYIHTHLCNLKIKRKTGRKYNSWIWLSQKHYLGEIDNPVMVYQKWNAIVFLFLAIKTRRKHCISHLFWKGHVVKKTVFKIWFQVTCKSKLPSILLSLTFIYRNRKYRIYFMKCKDYWRWNIRICMLCLMIQTFLLWQTSR